MRADNNWEDSVGKRLFDYEGELKPDAWNNIHKQIQPRQKRRWFLWLPLILLFSALPVAFYLHQQSADKNTENKIVSSKEATKNGISLSSKSIEKQNPENEETQENKTALKQAKSPQINTTQTENSGIKSTPDKVTNDQNQLALNGKSLPKPSRENNHPTSGVAILKDSISANRNENQPEISGRKNKVITKSWAVNTKKKPARKPARSGIVIGENAIAKTNKPLNFGKTKTGILNASESRSSKTEKQTVETNSNANSTSSAFALNSGKHNNGQLENPENKTSAPKNTSTFSEEKATVLSKQTAEEIAKVKADSAFKIQEDQNPETKLAATDSSTTKNEKPNRKFAFSFYATPAYTYQRVKANTKDEVMILKYNNANELTSGRLDYDLGFRSYFPVKENIELEAGVQFALLKQKLNFTLASKTADSVVAFSENGTVGMHVFNRELKDQQTFKYYFGGLYFGANTRLVKNLKLSGGFGTNWILKTNPDRNVSGIESHNFNPYLSAGLQYYSALNQSLTFIAGPTIQYYLRQTQDEKAYFGAKPTTIGFTVGLRFN